MSASRILIVEDEPIARENLSLILGREGYRVTAAADCARALRALEKEDFDLILTDLKLPDGDGMEVLSHGKRLHPEAEVVVITGHATVSSAVEAIRSGAYHYLPKPHTVDELLVLVKGALEKAALRREVARLRSEIGGGALSRLVGQSRIMRELKDQIAQIAAVECTALILGETGTGKELVARAIHELSPRSARRFVAINCASFNEELLANELFGHERGAFTGAAGVKKGLMELASGGTFFLDEIGDMALSMQAKLLRVLEERTLLRVGGTEEIPVDVRIVAATNKDLKKEVARGEFRADLYYRLNVIALRLPPLAERSEDIPLLCAHFLGRYAAAMGKPPELRISDEAMAFLIDYEYPGNVRELENIIERAVALCAGTLILPGHLPPDLSGRHLRLTRARNEELLTLQENEKRYLSWVLDHTQGNRTRAASILGIDRATLWRKLKRYGLDEG